MGVLNKDVGTLNVGMLLNNNLVIPEYQRPYTWTDEQIFEFLNDIYKAFDFSNETIYMVGNIIFHKKNEQLNIVDGQQRTITLALILYALEVESNELKILDQKIHKLSQDRVSRNFQYIKQFIEGVTNKKDFLKFVSTKIFVTYMLTEDEDEAFVLFDAQNTRGKVLERKDLLKVHHLRAVLAEKREGYAKSWEQSEKKFKFDDFYEHNGGFEKFFEQLLAFSRKAIQGELQTNDLLSIDVYKEFKTQSELPEQLNNYNQPAIFKSFTLSDNILSLEFKDEMKINYGNQLQIANGLNYIPFEILQSIEGGEKFFWYVAKYQNLYEYLSNNETFNKLDGLGGSGNRYLRYIYKSALFFYYDKFEGTQFKNFANHLLWILTHYRIKKDLIRREGVTQFKFGVNIYKVIYTNYSAQSLMAILKREIDFLALKELEKASGTKDKFYELAGKDELNSIKKFVFIKKEEKTGE